MQTQKENVRLEIIESAREEFHTKSFRNASMRSIASKAGVTTSNIYNYFTNKEEILSIILKPLILTLEQGKKQFHLFEVQNKRENENEDDLSAHNRMARFVATFINENRDSLNLLVFKTEGSSYETFVDNQIDWFTEEMKEGFLQSANGEVDEFLVHITASIWINSLREILMHGIEGEKVVHIFEEIMTFIFMGWHGLMTHKKIAKEV